MGSACSITYWVQLLVVNYWVSNVTYWVLLGRRTAPLATSLHICQLPRMRLPSLWASAPAGLDYIRGERRAERLLRRCQWALCCR